MAEVFKRAKENQLSTLVGSQGWFSFYHQLYICLKKTATKARHYFSLQPKNKRLWKPQKIMQIIHSKGYRCGKIFDAHMKSI